MPLANAAAHNPHGGDTLAPLDRRCNDFQGLTQGQILEHWSRVGPEKMAVVDLSTQRALTYGELNRRVDRLAWALHRLGVRPGDHIAYLLPDRLECVEILYALSKLGAVWSPCNYRFVDREILAQLDHADAQSLIFHDQFLPNLDRIRPHLRKIRHLIMVGNPHGPSAYIHYNQLLEQASDDPYPISIDDAAPCGLLYTSGTTGYPKGAIHTHRTFWGWITALIIQNGWRRDDRLLNPYPLFHMGGTGFTAAALQCGATVYLPGKFEPEKFLSLVEQEHISAMVAVPTILNAILKQSPESIAAHDWSCLRKLSTSSAPLMTDTKRLIHRYWPHVELYTIYSATEAFYTMLMPRDPHTKVRCVGRPAFGMALRIENEAGEPVGPGVPGLIYGRGISLFHGYYKYPRSADNFHDGWFTCRDIGFVDDEGYLYIVDRQKDLIISGGEKISSVEVEDVLLAHPAVREVAVIGVPDPIWGEHVHAVVVLKAPGLATAPELLGWCRGQLAGFKLPKSMEFAEEIPKSPMGKVLKRSLRDRIHTRAEGHPGFDPFV